MNIRALLVSSLLFIMLWILSIGNVTQAQQDYEFDVMALTNAERTSRGLNALTWDTCLYRAAEFHSQDMVDNNFFSHTGSNGSSLAQRAIAQGYNYRNLGENIAWGQRTPAIVVNAWMNSDGHRRNILNANFTNIGIGLVYDGSTPYWTMVLGRGTCDDSPSATPTNTPTMTSTNTLTVTPTNTLTLVPTNTPTLVPTNTPTLVPTNTPTTVPTDIPTSVPPTVVPPTTVPTDIPTSMPATVAPTVVPPTVVPPTIAPTTAPATVVPPTVAPTSVPPTTAPTSMPPTSEPRIVPTTVPPTSEPIVVPATVEPTTVPPTVPATVVPTTVPATDPTAEPLAESVSAPQDVQASAPVLPTPVPVTSSGNGSTSTSTSVNTVVVPVPTRLPDECEIVGGAVEVRLVNVSNPNVNCTTIGIGGVGNQQVVEMGFVSAVDVWGGFVGTVEVCLIGSNPLVFMDAANSPRFPEPAISYLYDNYTCTIINRPGIVVQVTSTAMSPVPTGNVAPVTNTTVTTTTTSNPVVTTNANGQTVHTVSAGENLFRIGLRYGVSVDAIMAANNMASNTIYVGQELVIP
ncbi:MAG: CAP domain-containing protein [Chloroflexota bacterium]